MFAALMKIPPAERAKDVLSIEGLLELVSCWAPVHSSDGSCACPAHELIALKNFNEVIMQIN